MNVAKNRIIYDPNDKSLQNAISEFVHRRVLESQTVTMAQLGYLHMSTIGFNIRTQAIELKLYFHAAYCVRPKLNTFTKKKEFYPVQELNMFQNYLFVGDVFHVYHPEEILAPKTSAVEDPMGRPSMVFDDSGKMVKTGAAVLSCSLPLTLAAINDISLTDRNFKVSVDTVGKAGKTSTSSIITSTGGDIVPVKVIVEHTAMTSSHESAGYDPNDAIPYLEGLADRAVDAEEMRDQVAEKVKERSHRIKKKRDTEAARKAGFGKLS